MKWDLAFDWDGTLVESATTDWYPMARGAVRILLGRGYTVVIHTCRVNWPEGLAQVHEGLEVAGFSGLDVWTQPGKPHAEMYVDNQSFPPFDGDWDALLAALPPKPSAFAQPKRRNAMWH